MKLVQTASELKENIALLDQYLERKTEPAYSFALNLVKNGVCFVTVRTEQGYRFYPSRFIGYAKNNMNSHEGNEWKDGKETNPAISKILGGKPKPDSELEMAYREYCTKLGFTARLKGTFGVERKYWRFDG